MIKKRAKFLLNTEGSSAAIIFLTSQPDFRYQIMAYGIMNNDGNYAQSRAF
ncbi:MAG: hypothetical protein IPO92_13615 [Saprospiraceae bacterium]|nr:hypothetical protein [Saprospiraceae bacterium]